MWRWLALIAGLLGYETFYRVPQPDTVLSTMLVPKDLWTLTATQAQLLLYRGTVSVEEYARSLLTRIDERDSTVQAWIYLDRQEVLDKAKALDKLPQSQRGPLHGVAVGIKDIIHTKDMPTQFGSRLYRDYRSNYDASLVSILRSAGALIFGKTTTTEFTILNSGPNTTNPHDSRRTPGGSSAGSAAAVADFQVPLSFGTQNGGSVIRPASYTGIFAMKPTLNTISAEGVKVASFTIDTCGFFARTVDDLQLVANVFALPGNRIEPLSSLEGLRIAFVETPIWPKAGSSTIRAMEKAATILESSGAEIHRVRLPVDLGDGQAMKRTHKVVLNSEARQAFLMEYMMDKSKLDPKIRGFVENTANFTLQELVEATNKYASMRHTFDQFAAEFDAIITPSAIDVAPLGLDDMGDSSFNFLWSGLHTPVVHIPAFSGTDGMPVGLSIVMGRHHDQDLLHVTKALSKPLMAEGGWKIVPPSNNAKI